MNYNNANDRCLLWLSIDVTRNSEAYCGGGLVPENPLLATHLGTDQ